MTFYEKLAAASKKNNSLLCIGLDSDINAIPSPIREGAHPQLTFNKTIIDATHDLVCAYKPNSAFYESRGKPGIEALKMTCDYLFQTYPDIVIILDAKRADIGSSNQGYVTFAFEYLKADAITLHPYLGREALKPFLDRKEKGSIILCRTSNPGASEFQDQMVEGKPLYQIVARNVAEDWNLNCNCGLVMGATYPTELGIVRRIVDGMPILIPGIGAQGGDIEATVKEGVDVSGGGAIINASRSVIFASEGADFSQKARAVAEKLRNAINLYRKKP